MNRDDFRFAIFDFRLGESETARAGAEAPRRGMVHVGVWVGVIGMVMAMGNWTQMRAQENAGGGTGVAAAEALRRQVGWVADNGDGTFRNPVLFADYSDPDVIRVGDDFYMVSSSFHYMPGIPVLHSKDLVNWRIIGHVYPRMDVDKAYDMGPDKRYGSGAWAPSIRYHDGTFYVYCCSVKEGLFMSTAKDPAGPWEPLTWVKRIPAGKGTAWEDPCPFWDDDGQAYLVHSLQGGGPLILHKMSPDGKQLLDEGKTIYEKNPDHRYLEGPKFHKRNGYYYIFAPAGGVEMGYQLVLRAKDIYGPYEVRKVLEQGKTSINGPHQGGYVETQTGEGWFMHFQQRGAYGRIVHLQPVKWVEDWPVMGDNGRPVPSAKKPDVGKVYPIEVPQTSDEFDSPKLGLQWQWNHNPLDSHWSLSERPGFMRLKPTRGDLHNCRNVLTQMIASPTCSVTTELDVSGMVDGQTAGLCVFGEPFAWVAVVQEKGERHVRMYYTNDWRKGQGTADGPAVTGKTVWLRASVRENQSATFSYSLDGKTYQGLGEDFRMYFSWWKGMRLGVFTHGSRDDAGWADFDRFHYGTP